MYNAFKFKKDEAEKKAQRLRVKPLKESDPEKAQRKMNRLSDAAKVRRQQWINKVNLDDENFQVFDYNENDSLAYKTSFFDFRGEKGRDKSLDISPNRFYMGNYKTAKQRALDAQNETLKNLFSEKYHYKEELRNQVMRPKEKNKSSPRTFQYRAISEVHRVHDTLNSQRRFEPEMFNANRLVQPDQFRLEMRHQTHNWVSPKRFIVQHKNSTHAQSVQADFKFGLTHTTMGEDYQAQNDLLTSSVQLPSIAAVDDVSRTREPYNKVSTVSNRGLGGNRVGSITDKKTRNQHDFTARTAGSTLLHNSQLSSADKSKMHKSLFVKRKYTQPNQNAEESMMSVNTQSNRFFDTFTKIQEINKHLELQIQSPWQPGRNNSSIKKNSLSGQMPHSTRSSFNKHAQQVNKDHDFMLIQSNNQAAGNQTLQPTSPMSKKSDGNALQFASSKNIQMVDSAQGVRIQEPTDEQKLQTIQEQLNATNTQFNPPFQLQEVMNNKQMRNQNLTFQQRTAQKCQIQNDWQDFMTATNQDFFDQNKLYIKSMADYKTKHHGSLTKHKNEQPILPKIGAGLSDTLKQGLK